MSFERILAEAEDSRESMKPIIDEVQGRRATGASKLGQATSSPSPEKAWKSMSDLTADLRAMRKRDMKLLEAKYARVEAQVAKDERDSKIIEAELLEKLGLA